MICCNKCGAVIEEPKEEEKKEEATPKGRYVKTAPKDELPIKRPSLVSMPTARAVNGYSYEDVDLCVTCAAKLGAKLADVKYEFMKSEEEK